MKKKKILIIVLAIILLFFVVDFSLVKNKKNPIFAINLITERDGGTEIYYGIGYKVIKYNVMGDTGEIVKDDYAIGTWFLKYDAD